MGFLGHPVGFLPGLWLQAAANSLILVGRNLGVALSSKFYGAAIAAGAYVLPFSVAGVLAIACTGLALLATRQTKVD